MACNSQRSDYLQSFHPISSFSSDLPTHRSPSPSGLNAVAGETNHNPTAAHFLYPTPLHPTRPKPTQPPHTETAATTDLLGGRFDLDLNARRQTQLIQGFDRFGRSLHNIDQPLVRPHLELLASLLVDKRAANDRVPLDPSRQRNWAMNFGVSPLGSVHNLLRTLVQNRMVEGLHADSNYFVYSSHYAISQLPSPLTSPTCQTTHADRNCQCRGFC